MTTHRLLHWNEREGTGFLDLDFRTNNTAIIVDVENDASVEESGARAVHFEVRDNGTLAVLCYPRDREDPIVVTLNADGTYEVSDE